MKKLVLSLCFMLLFLMSCQQKTPQASPNEEKQSDNSAEWITPVDTINLEDMNLYWERDNLQFVADENARISLYINASKDENNEFLFDDGHYWTLIMETSLGIFPLFPPQHVQLGGVSCVVYNVYDDSDIISHVLVTVQQTAGYQIYDCVYDSDAGAFKILPVHDAGNINFITCSP